MSLSCNVTVLIIWYNDYEYNATSIIQTLAKVPFLYVYVWINPDYPNTFARSQRVWMIGGCTGKVKCIWSFQKEYTYMCSFTSSHIFCFTAVVWFWFIVFLWMKQKYYTYVVRQRHMYMQSGLHPGGRNAPRDA